MFTVDPSTGRASTDRDRGRVRARRGRRRRPGRAGHVRRRQGRAARARRPGRCTRRTRSCAAPRGDERVELSAAEGARRVCTDDEIVALAALGLRVEEHYGAPQDIEWAIAGGRIFLVQSRPITTTAAAAPAPGVRTRAVACSCAASARRRGARRVRCGSLQLTGGRGVAAAGRGPRRADDEPRLGSDPAPRRRRSSPTAAA